MPDLHVYYWNMNIYTEVNYFEIWQFDNMRKKHLNLEANSIH